MTTTINASPTNGLVQTADGSGVLKVQSNGVTTNALAWVNFNGTGTVAIRSSYNVSSITDNGTGDYTINFATPMSDANYNMVGTAYHSAFAVAAGTSSGPYVVSPTQATASINVSVRGYTGTTNTCFAYDPTTCCVAIFGN